MSHLAMTASLPVTATVRVAWAADSLAADREGDCPRCKGRYGLAAGDRMLPHIAAGSHPGRPACPAAGRRARNARRRAFFPQEGALVL